MIFSENYQFWSLFKTETGKNAEKWIDFLREKIPKTKKMCIFFPGEVIKIGDVYMHFFPVHVMQFNPSKT